jgi:hypothetical protein
MLDELRASSSYEGRSSAGACKPQLRRKPQSIAKFHKVREKKKYFVKLRVTWWLNSL